MIRSHFLVYAWLHLFVSAQAQDLPRVVSAGKAWLSQDRLIRRGDQLKDPVVSGGKAAGELLLDCGEAGWYRYFCDSPACKVIACSETQDQANGVRGGRLRTLDGFYSSVLDRVQPLLKREPQEPVTLGVRSGGNPSDALLLQDAKGVHWGPALGRVIAGQHCFRIGRLPQDTSRVQVFMLNWNSDRDPEGVTQISNLAPGSYTLEKGIPAASGNCTADPDATAAWIVIVPESQYARANALWTKADSEITDLEQSGLSLSTINTIRHALVAGLADSIEAR